MAEREFKKFKTKEEGWTPQALKQHWFNTYITVDGDCWVWSGTTTNTGTASTTIKFRHPVSRKRLYSVMRVLKAIDDPGFKQPRFSSSVCAKHGRDCVNPAHWSFSKTLKPKTGQRLNGRGNRDLTPEQVLEIRGKLAQKIPATVIAKEYNVSSAQILNIKHNKRWEWLQTQADLDRERQATSR